MARIFLKVTNVRVERLQDIGNKDLKFVFVTPIFLHETKKIKDKHIINNDSFFMLPPVKLLKKLVISLSHTLYTKIL